MVWGADPQLWGETLFPIRLIICALARGCHLQLNAKCCRNRGASSIAIIVATVTTATRQSSYQMRGGIHLRQRHTVACKRRCFEYRRVAFSKLMRCGTLPARQFLTARVMVCFSGRNNMICDGLLLAPSRQSLTSHSVAMLFRRTLCWWPSSSRQA